MNTNNNRTDENKRTLTSEQKQKMKKYAVFASMFIIFGVSLWWIFASSADEKAKREHEERKNRDQQDLQERLNALNARQENRPQPTDDVEEDEQPANEE